MILTGLLLGTAVGFAMQRARFCVTGAFRDVWLSRSTRWLTAFLLVVAIQAVGVAALTGWGLIAPQVDPLPVVATVVGSFIFGFAIVLAGGCATGTYYRSGEGLVGSWIALIFYGGLAAAMKYGALAPFNDWARSVTTVELTTIPQTFGLSPWYFIAALVIGVGILVHRHRTATRALQVASLPPRRTGVAHLLFEKTWTPFAAAGVIGVLAILAWPLSSATGRNSGLGITTPSANVVTYGVTGDLERIDWGVMLVLGLLIGSYIAARGSGEFRLRVPDATTVVRSIAGGSLMGVGAALAGGCTIGNAMVETALMSYQGWISLTFMILGTGAAAWLFILRRPRVAAGTPGVSAGTSAGNGVSAKTSASSPALARD